MKKNKFLMFAAAAVLFASCGGGGGRPTFGDNEYPVLAVGTPSRVCRTCRSVRKYRVSLPRLM